MRRGLQGVRVLGWVPCLIIPGCFWDVSNLFVDARNEDFVITGRTQSHFEAIQVDPRSEDSAGPTFVKAADFNRDGLLDLVTAWSESQPIQVHLQRPPENGGFRFETVTIAGSIPITSIADLEAADLDADGRVDIVVMVKIRDLADDVGGPFDGAILVFFGPEDAADVTDPFRWQEVLLVQTDIAGSPAGDGLDPELGGYTAMAIGDLDGDQDLDIVAALNAEPEEDEELSGGRVELFTNPGAARARRGGEWERFRAPGSGQLSLEVRPTLVRDVALMDVDEDFDLDVVVTRPDARSMNARWLRNPLIDSLGVSAEWTSHVIGHVGAAPDIARVGDVDGDGLDDVVVRSSQGNLIQWFKSPRTPAVTRQIPWQVYTLAEFRDRPPEAVELVDLDFDGRVEVVATARGGLAFFKPPSANTAEDPWVEYLIVDDAPPVSTDDPDAGGAGTLTRAILATDLDGDGATDLVVPLDRDGINDDAVVWLRNTLTPPR